MILQGEGFTLRNWQKEDAALLQKHADNTHITDFLFDRFPSPYTLQDAIDFIDIKMAEAPQTNFPIVINGEVAGVIGLDFRGDIYIKAPLLGYWLSEDYWGKGIMPGAVRLIVDYGFKNLDIARIQAGVLGNNPKSMRVLEKAGFVKEGILADAIFKQGVILDEHVYGIVKRG
jgi:ribosomal-protein-alanine N-acetyltransferase